MGFKLTYYLEGAGWATARIQDGDTHVDITVSYLHDSLRDLAEAARALAFGATFARVVFMDEPGEVQLVLHRDDDSLAYEARWFDDWSSWGMHPADQFEVLLSGVTTVRRFIGEVRSQLEALLREHGTSGYKDKWVESDFPEDLLIQLRNAPKTEPGRWSQCRGAPVSGSFQSSVSGRAPRHGSAR
jgi:hypothetical protein